jgi:ubiquinol-cytochrome c reductase iron-sulfur subunit
MSGSPEARGDRAVTRGVASLFVVAILSGLGLLVLYARGGQVQLEGALLGLLFCSLGLGLVLWGKYLIPPEVVTEERVPHPSPGGEVAAAEGSFEAGERIARRTLLTRLLLGVGGAIALALVFPIRSLGPSPGRSLFRTAWRRGARLVDENGHPIQVDTLPEGGVVTVFPEGYTGAEDSQAILVRVAPTQLRLPSGNHTAPSGNVCYSKICTHAGCPVGLYSALKHQLQCPCHQSAFDVTLGAKPVFGPAPRPLPQLELFVDRSGFLRATGDFTAPVGPSFWNLNRSKGGA